jgi:hypothetical protein
MFTRENFLQVSEQVQALGWIFLNLSRLMIRIRSVVSKGTKATTGYSLQISLNYHTERFFAGFEFKFRNYGHKIEDISRLIKQYSYFQLFIGWRLRAPGFAKKSLDWVNKKSPIAFD